MLVVKEKVRLHLWITTLTLTPSFQVHPHTSYLTLESTSFDSILSHLLLLKCSVPDCQSIVTNAINLTSAIDPLVKYCLEKVYGDFFFFDILCVSFV